MPRNIPSECTETVTEVASLINVPEACEILSQGESDVRCQFRCDEVVFRNDNALSSGLGALTSLMKTMLV